MNEEEDDMEKMLEQLHEKLKKQADLKEAVNEKLEPITDHVEKEILMKLWSNLGNSQYDYYMNMIAVKKFITALGKVRNITHNGMPLPLVIMMQEALVECCQFDLKAYKILHEEREKAGME